MKLNLTSLFISILAMFILLSFNIVGRNLVDGVIFGDALNFYSYRHDILNKTSYSLSDLNVAFVSIVYVDYIYAALFNGISLSIIIIILYKCLKNYIFFVVFILFLNGEWVFRFNEPSREFLLYPIMVLVGVYRYDKKHLELAVSLILVLFLRPAYVITLPFIFLVDSFIYLLFYFLVTYFLLANYSHLLPVDFSTRLGDYKTGVSNNIFVITLLNYFGGFNSFFTERYSDFHRLIYLFSYISNVFLIIITFIYANNRCSVLFFMCGISLFFALLTNFPHPRYLTPFLYFIFGYVFAQVRSLNVYSNNI